MDMSISEHSYWYRSVNIIVKNNYNGTHSYAVYVNGNTVAYGSAALSMDKVARIAESAVDEMLPPSEAMNNKSTNSRSK